MASEMIFGQLNEFGRRFCREVAKDLAMDMVAQLLDIELVVS
jgi:hypothetical protein